MLLKSAQFYQSSKFGPHKRCYILQKIIDRSSSAMSANLY